MKTHYKKNLLLVVLLFACCIINTSAQAPSWAWAHAEGGTGDDNTTGIATDASGNVYIIGAYQSSPLAIGDTTLPNAGNWDVFLAKYDAAGNFIWARSAGGSSRDE